MFQDRFFFLNLYFAPTFFLFFSFTPPPILIAFVQTFRSSKPFSSPPPAITTLRTIAPLINMAFSRFTARQILLHKTVNSKLVSLLLFFLLLLLIRQKTRENSFKIRHAPCKATKYLNISFIKLVYKNAYTMMLYCKDAAIYNKSSVRSTNITLYKYWRCVVRVDFFQPTLNLSCGIIFRRSITPTFLRGYC